MAVGDQVVGGTYNVANNGTIDIQPAAGVEWLITTVGSQAAKSMEVYYLVNGTDAVLVDSLTGGSSHGLQWRLTNTQILRLKNTSGGSALLFYAGVVTK
jgi:hypothetical protein